MKLSLTRILILKTMVKSIALTLCLLLFGCCLRVLGQLLHLGEKHLDGGEHLVPNVLLFVHCECAESWEDPAGYVSGGVVDLGGRH